MKNDRSIQIETLNSEHLRDGFDCGDAALNKYLQSSVDRDLHNRLTRCYVSVLGKKVNGFYTLSNYALRIAQLPKRFGRKIPPRYLVPTILLGRLAVNKSDQGKGLGGLLLIDAIRRSLAASQISNAFALVVHAKSEQAKAFYSHYGFIHLMDESNHLFLPLQTAGLALE